VFVRDRYPGLEARTFLECSDGELEGYLQANVKAVAEVAGRVEPQGALANHLLLGPAVLARALGGAVPTAIKVHGSELLYVLSRARERFLPWVREGVEAAGAVLVGSSHIAGETVFLLGEPVAQKLRLFPPGVAVETFSPYRPRLGGRRAVVGAVAAELRQLGRVGGGDFAIDGRAAARALEAIDPVGEPLIAFVGKLIPAKGPDIALLAHLLLLEELPRARLLLIGYGPLAGPLRETVRLAGEGELARAAAVAGEEGLTALASYLSRGAGEAVADRFRRLAAQLTWLGRLEHPQLAPLLSLCEAVVVPSRLPEAFGMVAAEAAACGALPIVADHSGLREVAALLAGGLPSPARPLLLFPSGGEGAAPALKERLLAWLSLPAEQRVATRRALVEAARRHLSWEGAASRLVALFERGAEALPRPAVDGGGPLR